MENNFSDVDRVLGQPSNKSEAFQSEVDTGKTSKFRPTNRPAMAILQVFDDGRESCESVRLRSSLTSIGRSDCDVCIPHDAQISLKHLFVKRKEKGGKSQWTIEDVSDKAMGLFVRVRRARLRHQSEFLIGAQRIVFNAAMNPAEEGKSALTTRLNRGSIPGESTDTESVSCASLSVLSNPRLPKLWLLGNDYWIGRNAACALNIAEDPFVAPQHVRITRQEDGQWQVRSNKAPNGLWIRVSAINVKSTCTFQIGEQRLRLIIS